MKHTPPILPYLIYIIIAFSFSSCLIKKDESKVPSLPEATGKEGSVLVVLPQPLWQDTLMIAIDHTLSFPPRGIKALFNQEPLFKISKTSPKTYRKLNRHRTILIPVVLNDPNNLFDTFTSRLAPSIKNEVNKTGASLNKEKNKYAKGQEIIYLIGKNKKELLSYLSTNSIQLRQYLHDLEIQRKIKQLSKERKNKIATEAIMKKFSLAFDIPSNYKVAMDTTNFIWLRSIQKKGDLNLFIHSSKYQTEAIFMDAALIRLRNDICKQYIFESDAPSSFMTTETDDMPEFHEIPLDSNYSKECRGLWRINTSMGGTFISYTLVHPKTNKVIYLEGFLHNPGEKKLPELRKLESVLRSISII